MKPATPLTAIIEREGDGFVSLCLVDVASQGKTVEQAWSNLIEALELFLKMPMLQKFAAATKEFFVS